MKNGVRLAGLVLLALASVVRANNWTSPDGNLGLNLPMDGSLVSVPNPPAPATAIWTTPDQSSRLVFLTQPNPQNAHLIQSDLEKGTLNAFPGGTLISSTETSIDGVPLFTIAGNDKSQSVFFQQSILTCNGTVYKLMAGGQTQISTDPLLTSVFQSIAVLKPVSTIMPGPKPLDGHSISVGVGQIGIYVLIIAGIVHLVRRKTNKPKPPPLP